MINGSGCSSTHLNSSLSASQTSLPPPPAPADLDDMMILNNASLAAAGYHNNHHHYNHAAAAETNHNSHYYAPGQVHDLSTDGHYRMGGSGNNGEGCVDVLDGGDPETVSMECVLCCPVNTCLWAK